MRRVLLLCAGAIAGLVLSVYAPARASAEILVRINRAAQVMNVTVDGVPRYQWRISSGRRGLATPAGTFHPHSMARRWYSHKYHNSPMPHSIFFRGGIAIHGTYETRYLGRPVSHGCVRLLPANAAILFDLVRREGMGATTIVVR